METNRTELSEGLALDLMRLACRIEANTLRTGAESLETYTPDSVDRIAAGYLKLRNAILSTNETPDPEIVDAQANAHRE